MGNIILVTGGGGFIGSNLVASLQDTQYRIVVCDRFGESGQWQNLVHHRVDEVIDPTSLFYWLEMFGDEVESIVHFGNISDTTETNVDALLEANHSSNVLLWRWCAEADARFFYASSYEVYGDGSCGFVDSDDPADVKKLRPLNASGWTKKLFDQFVTQQIAAGAKTPRQWAGLRFFNLYGPNEYHKDQHQSVVAKLYADARYEASVKLFRTRNAELADGEQQRDFIYIKDAVNVVLWLLSQPDKSGIYNVGSGQAQSFNHLAQSLFAALEKEPNIKYVDMPPSIAAQYQAYTQANIDKLRAAGFDHTMHSLEDGVKDYVQSYLLKADPYR